MFIVLLTFCIFSVNHVKNWYYTSVILFLLNGFIMIRIFPFSVILKRRDSLLEYSSYISFVKPLLPEHEKGRSVTALGDNFSHVSLQDDPWLTTAKVVYNEELFGLIDSFCPKMGNNIFTSICMVYIVFPYLD